MRTYLGYEFRIRILSAASGLVYVEGRKSGKIWTCVSNPMLRENANLAMLDCETLASDAEKIWAFKDAEEGRL